MKNFPRIIISATQSGAGKTTITAGLLSALKKRGLRVQSYKIGPDYIDPGYHEIASGRTAHNLDSWLVGKEKLAEIFCETFADANMAIIEGVMGLFDGGRDGISSTAEISKILNVPVVLVIDAKSMGASAAAVALGFREFDKSVNIAGVLLNRVGSDSHKKMIADELERLGINFFGAIKRDENFYLPERHLGLVPTAENNSGELIEYLGEKISEQIDVDELIKLANSALPLETKNFSSATTKEFSCKIAVARDEAFNFYYGESLRELEKLGAEIVFFSPLNDKNLPKEIDGLIIGGGFPEMFAERLESNKSIRAEIFKAAETGLPIFAECGGFMYLMKSICDFDGKIFDMCGVIPSRAEMTNKLQIVGYVEGTFAKDCLLGKAGEKIHAHEFHFSKEIDGTNDKKIFNCRRLRTGVNFSEGYCEKNILASYLHIHFAGCPKAAKNFIKACICNKNLLELS